MRKFLFISGFLLLSFSFLFAQEEKFVYDPHGRRDPFLRLVTSSGNVVSYESDYEINDLALEGIIFDPAGKSLAIINGNVVKLSDKMGVFVVSEITQNKVVLLKGEEKFVLELKKEE